MEVEVSEIRKGDLEYDPDCGEVVNIRINDINFEVSLESERELAGHYSHSDVDVEPLMLAEALEQAAQEIRKAVAAKS